MSCATRNGPAFILTIAAAADQVARLADLSQAAARCCD
jgi:hypothetical protein